jgi:hypothetical protein
MSETPKAKRKKRNVASDNDQIVITNDGFETVTANEEMETLQILETVARAQKGTTVEAVIESTIDDASHYERTNYYPMLQSFRLLNKAYNELCDQVHKSYVKKILKIPENIRDPLFVFIDLDWAMHQDGYLRAEVQEIASMYTKMDYKVYAVTTKYLSDLQLFNVDGGFSEIFYHPSGTDIIKASTFQTLIQNEVPLVNRHLLIFGGPLLISNLDGYYNSTLDLVVDISFDNDTDTDDSNTNPNETDFKKRPPLNIEALWLLEDYSIMEYILYYIAIHKTIREFAGYDTIQQTS